MTNEQNNKSITVKTCKTREPLEFKTIIKLDGETGKDISKLHTITTFSKITNREVLESEMLISGETVVFALYETDDGEFVECKGESTWETKTLMLGASSLLCDAKVVDYDVLGYDSSEITVNCLHNIFVKEIIDDEVAVDIEETIGLEKNEEIIEVSKVSGIGTSSLVLSEEFEVSASQNARIIARNVEAIIDNTFSGVDVVTVSGNLNVMTMLQDDGEIKNIEKLIPFKGEVECFGANPGNQIDATVNVSKVMAGIRESEQKNIIALDIEIETNVISFGCEEVKVIKDAFSAVSKTSISAESVNVLKLNSVGYGNVNVDFTADLQGKLGVDEVVSVIEPNLNIASSVVENGECSLEGVVEVLIIYNNNNENNVQSFVATCPFLANFNIGEEYNKIDDFKIKINDFKLKSGKEIQIDADIFYTLKNENIQQIVYVSNVEYMEDDVQDNIAIKVYTVKDGEEIFDIAKNLGVTVSNLISQNPDLESGVVTGEKVYVYSPLVINF